MPKQYLRVSDQWTKILDPRDDDTYMVNASGTTIHVFMTPWDIPPRESDHTYAIGGTIGQISCSKDHYIFAKASTTGALSGILDGVLAMDTSPVNVSLDDDLKKELEGIGIQVMKLTERMSDQEVDFTKHDLAFQWFVREMLNDIRYNNERVANIYVDILNHNLRLFAAERFMLEQQRTNLDLESLIKKVQNTEELTSISAKLAAVSTTVSALSTNLNQLKEQVANTGDSSILVTQINPLRKQVEELDSSYAYLNNSLVSLAEQSTSTEIENLFEELAKGTPDKDTLKALTAIKNLILELKTACEVNDQQEASIATKVGKDDMVGLETGSLREVADMLDTDPNT